MVTSGDFRGGMGIAASFREAMVPILNGLGVFAIANYRLSRILNLLED